jgi:hypothetical protein
MNGTVAAPEHNGRSFADRVVGDIAQNWPGYTLMGLLAAGPGLAVGIPALALAGAVAAPLGMGIQTIREAERHFGPGADGNGQG